MVNEINNVCEKLSASFIDGHQKSVPEGLFFK
jgi:hypothetical protein